MLGAECPRSRLTESEAQQQVIVHSATVSEALGPAIHRSRNQGNDDSTCIASVLGWSIERLRNKPIGNSMHDKLRQQQYLAAALISIAATSMENPAWTLSLDCFGNRAAKRIDPYTTIAYPAVSHHH
jgi:hypothetical protein